MVSVRILHIPHGEGPYWAVIKTDHSSKLNWADLKIIWHKFYLMILGQDSSNHIGPFKTLPPEYFVCIYWTNLTKFSSKTYDWIFLKISWICTVPNAHISLWLYKMCQMVATFSVLSSNQNCKKHTLKQNRPVQVRNKHTPYIIPFFLWNKRHIISLWLMWEAEESTLP